MQNLLSKAILFIKENPKIIYSLVLIVFIPAAFFFNTYRINVNYEENTDKITQRKAAMIENIINNLIADYWENDQKLQEAIQRIMRDNQEVTSLTILKPQSTDGNQGFIVAASSDEKLIGQNQNDSLQNVIAWSKPEGVAFLDRNDQGRFWNVTKQIYQEPSRKVGLISMALSLKDSDALISQMIRDSYWMLVLTILIVILLVSNQARIFGYALTLAKLKEIDQMKDVFISMASHELRSPLTAIKGYLELLKEKKEIQADQESAHFVDNVCISVNRLNDLVNDLLEVSRIEGNRIPIELTTFDPHPLITGSIEELRSQAIQKDLALNYKPETTTAMIQADNNRLKQILVNFIGNAIKYTKQGSVDVLTSIKDNNFLITVADTGIGISAEDQKKLFQKFSRIQNSETKNIIGTGLGLWITQELASKMNAKITVESIEGVGSHFTIQLPLVKN